MIVVNGIYYTNKISCIDTKIAGLMKWSVVLRIYSVTKKLTTTFLDMISN